MKIELMVSAALVLLLSSGLYAAEAKTFKGYVADITCFSKPGNISADGANLSTNPEKHTVACMQMKVCSDSGYLLLNKGADDKYTGTKLDAKGNKMVLALLKKTKKKDSFYVTITGSEKDGIIKVRKMKEATPEY